MGKLLSELGGEHETAWIDARESEGRSIKRFDAHVTQDASTLAELHEAARATVEAMREGWEIIYQPFFFDGTWQGRADFLVRVPRPSLLGDFSYEVFDAKLARHVRAEALLQLCEYSLQLQCVQGIAPEHMHVLLGDGTTSSHRVDEFSSYHLMVRRDFEAAVLQRPETYPNRVSHCNICEFSGLCDAKRRSDDHLSLVARMRRDQVRKLNEAGILRLDELARIPRETSVPNLQQQTFETLRDQARLQLDGRGLTRPLHELLPNDEPGFGLSALPEPSPGDVFFDMEGDGLHEQALEYLFGAVYTDDGATRYRSWLGHSVAEERRAFEDFVDWVIARLHNDPGMHVYHYADYERSALQRLMGRHATRESEVDRLLRGGVLVDLYRVVRQSVRLSTEGYGLKQVELLYQDPREGEVADAESSVVVYEQWRRSGDASLLDSIVAYNEVDCVSTQRLREWLEERRLDHERLTGAPLGRPLSKEGAPSDEQAQHERASEALRARLADQLPADREQRSREEQATWLLAQLLGYHRRETRVGWWRWFRLVDMTEDELQDDRDALGPLEFDAVVGTVKSSDVMRYRFTPQEHAIREGKKVSTPVTVEGGRVGAFAGVVSTIDNVAGVVELVRGGRV
ncbi:MAG: TM0106 family RecB-like putative nuclease, partial [Candidatus Dormibacteraeota bacterium]|nr:TM0106 family RecB-like putative nuclease [Candidatus Dormibacteraeota bacterium]